MIRRSTIVVAAVAGLAALSSGGVALANAVGGDEDAPDVPATGDELARASAAALAAVGEGRVTGSEIGDEESYYEIEVTLDDGRQIDVQLDRDVAVVSTADDHRSDHPDD